MKINPGRRRSRSRKHEADSEDSDSDADQLTSSRTESSNQLDAARIKQSNYQSISFLSPKFKIFNDRSIFNHNNQIVSSQIIYITGLILVRHQIFPQCQKQNLFQEEHAIGMY